MLTSDCLRDLAAHASSGVTVVCGFPAAGKTTATRMLVELVDPIVFDKDTFVPHLEEAVMAELTGNPHDRDSDLYRRVVAPHVYAALVQQAVTVGRRCPVIVDAPFLGYIDSAGQLGLRLTDYFRTFADVGDVGIRTVWVGTDTAQIRKRMIQRGAAHDRPKLADWDAYRVNVLESGLAHTGPRVTDHLISN
ncbi:AAA family ATPase [Nocardia grenadensis]|uniref:AAA family ATPase n=1 Tax=Nocardia grenadensis TaxID=931537 RepID=UPI0007A430B7|nr:AAA family ATPase [Nocardia grenadensis]